MIRNPNRPAVPVIDGLTSDDPLSAEIEMLVATEVNPALAAHGGFVTYVGHDGVGTAYLTMGGGCHGCSMSRLTMLDGVQTMLVEAIEAIEHVKDLTDHSTGENPYYSADRPGRSAGIWAGFVSGRDPSRIRDDPRPDRRVAGVIRFLRKIARTPAQPGGRFRRTRLQRIPPRTPDGVGPARAHPRSRALRPPEWNLDRAASAGRRTLVLERRGAVAPRGDTARQRPTALGQCVRQRRSERRSDVTGGGASPLRRWHPEISDVA